MIFIKSKWTNEIEGLEECVGYKVYSDGTIESYKKRHGHQYVIVDKPVRKLKPYKTKRGYLKVSLGNKNIFLHRLVALAFIPNPLNKPQINHIDCNKENNCVTNLEWCTNEENHKHKCENGLNVALKGEQHYLFGKRFGEHPKSKKIIQCSLEGEEIRIFGSATEAAFYMDCHRTTITHALRNGKIAKGFLWKYA